MGELIKVEKTYRQRQQLENSWQFDCHADGSRGCLGLPDLSGIVYSPFSNASDSRPRGLSYVNNRWQDRVIDAFRQIDQRTTQADPHRLRQQQWAVIAAGDEVAYHWGDGTREGSTEVHLADLLVGHCGQTPAVGWRVFTGEEPGRWTGAGRF
jgi:hypothetical protein